MNENTSSNVMLFNITKKHVWRNYDVHSEGFKKMTLQQGYGTGEVAEVGIEPGDLTEGANVLDTRSLVKKEQQAYDIKAPVYNNFLDSNNLYGHKMNKDFFKNHIKYYLPPVSKKSKAQKNKNSNKTDQSDGKTAANPATKTKKISINEESVSKLPSLKKAKGKGSKEKLSFSKSGKGSLPSSPGRRRSSAVRQISSPRRGVKPKQVDVSEDYFPSLNNIYNNEQDFNRNKELFVLQHLKRSEKNSSPICRQTITQLSKQLKPKETVDVRNYLGMNREANNEDQAYEYDETEAPANSVMDHSVSNLGQQLRTNAESNYEKTFYSRLGLTSLSRTSSKSSSSMQNVPKTASTQGSAYSYFYQPINQTSSQFETTQNAKILQNLQQNPSKFNQKIWTCDILGERYCKNCIECHIRGFARIFEKKFMHNTDPDKIVAQLLQDKLMNPKFNRRYVEEDDDDDVDEQERRDNLFDIKPSKASVQYGKDEYYRQINKKIKNHLRVHE